MPRVFEAKQSAAVIVATQIEELKKVNCSVYEAKVLAAAVTEKSFSGVEKLFVEIGKEDDKGGQREYREGGR